MEADRTVRAVIVGAELNHMKDYEHSMEELKSLAEACDMVVAARIDQSLSGVNPAYYIGSGKVGEVAETAALLDADYCIFNTTLSPAQLRNLQNEIGAAVMDRTNLILEIFSRRAGTREARLQVESASLQYLLPRLVGMRDSLSRQGGGAGAGGGSGAGGGLSNRGAGEKKLELDRRKIEKRMSELRRELETMEKDRETQRKRRNRTGIPQAALAGYTNAGKSTLMNLLLQAGTPEGESREEKRVLEQDMLFATLDTSVRRISPGDHRDFLLSDTVGFISELPHDLIKAFRSTLEEVRQADLIIQVIDCSDEHHREHREVTDQTLRELGAGDIPCIYVMNKADRVMDKAALPRRNGDRIYLSAKYDIGTQELLALIQEKLFADYRGYELLIPYAEAKTVSFFQENAVVHKTDYLEEGIALRVSCLSGQVKPYLEYVR